MIHIDHIQHQFGDNRVINDFELNINKGDIVTFIGKSGCGKSTLLNIIGGFLTPTSGTVNIDGEFKQTPSPDCLMIFQHHNLLPWKNINDNIRIGLSQQLSDKEINNYLKSVDLNNKGTLFPEELSGGMKQRVALCRAQVHQPNVILMDEPLGALDAFTRYKLQDQLVQLKEQTSATIILVTHDIDEAIYLSDNIVLLGNDCEIISQYNIKQSHPRNRNDSHLLNIRNVIMEKFALNHHMAEPEYYL
ncbi:ABC transporter ATP-binding protein [Staphylococcus shinii]|uniref:ABC transporter ATP-binding protein n=1 Tax=Staphylococcus shinii TaxID=2912228 RepID=A0A418IIW5_9STAP|nr:ABC transporter ATP-binding protein [Staphylococcus shinii]MDW8565821.1 ABC transporter ATP-binding protein [Staphylococcus shinii]MDW8566329.1 ABC transporter ATP-binding protein [Staphylococcus shinii]PKI10226.1 ABC transporter ATP-binding protein [Staphylococcus shinii]RIN02868.1 ABC transporter ATP-binding protein [Staphylococcus shinii]RIN08344.1 ABC transporter ATP-binding protein [Staphylococcus shinii]